jgi:signal transduction histidine kinase
LTTLLHQSRAAGVPIIYHVEGKPCELDPSVELATYWIVREGLTNVLKHAGKDAKPQLRLAWESHRLLIEIDNGTNQASTYTRESPVGHGLVGMRERAHAVGGRLEAGPHPKVGYRLSASLPLATAAARPDPDALASTIVQSASQSGRGIEGAH